MFQQDHNAVMWLQGLGVRSSHLIHDWDIKFSIKFRAFGRPEGIKCLKTPVRTPQANTFSRCCIGKIKGVCLDHFVCFCLDHDNYINRQWLYYNKHRPHQGADAGNKVFIWDMVLNDDLNARLWDVWGKHDNELW